jgi:hypothetical protein
MLQKYRKLEDEFKAIHLPVLEQLVPKVQQCFLDFEKEMVDQATVDALNAQIKEIFREAQKNRQIYILRNSVKPRPAPEDYLDKTEVELQAIHPFHLHVEVTGLTVTLGEPNTLTVVWHTHFMPYSNFQYRPSVNERAVPIACCKGYDMYYIPDQDLDRGYQPACILVQSGEGPEHSMLVSVQLLEKMGIGVPEHLLVAMMNVRALGLAAWPE